MLLLLLLHHFSCVRFCATRPWDSPGKNTEVGCRFLLQCMKVKNESEVAQSCPTLSDPMDCSLPSFSVHGIFQARVLEWVAIAFSECILAYHKIFPNIVYGLLKVICKFLYVKRNILFPCCQSRVVPWRVAMMHVADRG